MKLPFVKNAVAAQTAADLTARYCIYAKIYGERNTGTNLVDRLLAANFAVESLQGNSSNKIVDYTHALQGMLPSAERGRFRSTILDMDCERFVRSDFGWKHGIPPRQQILSAPHSRHTLFICIAKHPFAWLRSLARRPYNSLELTPKTFSQFLRYGWPLAIRDNLAGNDRINVVELWNVKNAALVELQSVARNYVRFAYEDVLRDPLSFLSTLSGYLVPRKDEFVWSLPSTKGDDMTFDMYRDKYAEDKLLAGALDEDVEFVARHADRKVMGAFGYTWPERFCGESSTPALPGPKVE